MMRYVSLFLVLFALSISKGRAQDSIENGFLSVQEVIAELFAQSDEEINLDESVDYLYQLASNPVKINKADEQEMKRIFWLSDFQVANLISYIKSNGQLQSAFEVAYIEGFTERDAKLLAPFLDFDIADSEKEFNFKEFTGYAKQKYILRIQKGLEEQAGFKPDEYNKTSFTGDPLKYYLRYHWYNDNISAGITGEKDSGEEFFTGSNPRGFDFYSYHLQVKNLKVIKNLILGDYKLNFGQGLVTGSAFSLGKMPSLLNSSYQNSGINRYTATGENDYFRGVACTIGYKLFEASVFYSNTSIDANISLKDSITGKTQEVSSLQTTGIHATSYEIKDEDALESYVYGSNIKVRANNAEIGLTALFSTFNIPVNPVDQPYNVGYFRGKSNYAMGLNYRLRTGKILWFGESAMSENKNLATINGFQTYVFSGLSLNVIYRNYQRAYQSLYGNAFGENSRNQNESGFYFGLQCNPFKYTSLLGYADFFSFPALGYKVDMPSEGQEYLGQITVTPNAWFQMYVQYRFKQKETNETIEDAINNKIVPVKTQRCRLGLSYAVSQNIILKNRLEYTMYNKGVHSYSEGYLLSQDVNISLPNVPVKVYMRYALFDTDTYDSRIYEYESDLLYSFSIPAFYDKGSRVYLMAKLSSSGNTDFWIKYSSTQYANKETISSGLYEIKGNRKSEIKMQVIINL